MSALAHGLLDLGCIVTGSDTNVNERGRLLRRRGAAIFDGHALENLGRPDLVCVSDAIPAQNPEVLAAHSSGCDVLRRPEMLRHLLGGRKVVGVTGSHGKSSTAAMITWILRQADLDPSFFIGADLVVAGGVGGRIGGGEIAVVEACEAFRNLRHLDVDVAVLTNVDDDHSNHYGGEENLHRAFAGFANAADIRIVNGKDLNTCSLSLAPVGTLAFGIGDDEETLDVVATNVDLGTRRSAFDVWVRGSRVSPELAGRIDLGVVGAGMLSNCLAAVACCLELGVEFSVIQDGLKSFVLPRRRWDDHGITAGIRVIDDFSHHPTSLRHALECARVQLDAAGGGDGAAGGRLILGFEMSANLVEKGSYQQVAAVLRRADRAVLLQPEHCKPVGSCLPVPGVESPRGGIVECSTQESLLTMIGDWILPGDLVLFAGEGKIEGAAERLVAALEEGTLSPENSTGAVAALEPSLERSPQPSPGDSLVVDILDVVRHAAKGRPDHVAVECGEQTLSYAELIGRAEVIAEGLRGQGLGPGAQLALAIPPSPDLIAAQLASWMVGAAFLSLDSSLPSARLITMIKIAQINTVLVSPAWPANLNVDNGRTIRLQSMAGCAPTEALFVPSNRGTIAYLSFTSGTTGEPKGIPVKRESVSSFCRAACQRLPLTSRMRTLVTAPPVFDAWVAEVFLTLSSAGTIVLSEPGERLVGSSLASSIGNRKVSHLFATPTMLETLPEPLPASLEVVVAGGEVLPQSLADRIAHACDLYNGYGPTEATVYSTIHRHEWGRRVSIGEPLDHVELSLRDEHGAEVAEGERGEICLGGVGVFDGYLTSLACSSPSGDPSLQSSSRGHDPNDARWWLHQDGSRFLFRTGDLARKNADRSLSFLGRNDSQVKVRGNRIEVEEIEALVRAFGEVENVVVTLDEATEELHAYCWVNETRPPAEAREQGSVLFRRGRALEAKLRKHLDGLLPSCMQPQRYVWLGSSTPVPRTVSGKTDRQGVPLRFRPDSWPRPAFDGPESEVERRLAALWSEILGVSRVGRSDDFVNLGGNSLLQMQLVLETETEFSVSIPPGYFGSLDVLSGMAEKLESLLAKGPGTVPHKGAEEAWNSILRKQRELTSDWSGDRTTPQSLIVSTGSAKAARHLVWCLQNGRELSQLEKQLGAEVRIHGLRSGHLLMEYSEENIEMLSDHYVDELEGMNLVGPVAFGGNCQGGQIAHAVARRMQARGQDVTTLILLDQARFPPFDGRICFVFGERSFLNPHRRYTDGLSNHQQAYPEGFEFTTIPFGHGEYFSDAGIVHLADAIREWLRPRRCVGASGSVPMGAL